MKFKKTMALLLSLIFAVGSLSFFGYAEPAKENTPDFALDCRSAILMEAHTGQVLYEMNADEALPPASVTKVMTLLLVMEAIEEGRISLTDMVSASANACSMGGSQIFLEEGEQMSVEDLLKSVVISSANDAAVALAEYVGGSESAFVSLMNRRAQELGMKNTCFENTNGLDDTVEKHLTSARDIAIMSRELIKHKKITEYSSIWMDTIRGGQFGLTNTNRLVRFYKGATGLKTGSTSKAKFCISATAERDGMSLICVIMAAPTRDIRNEAAKTLLDFGFANYALYKNAPTSLGSIRVVGGVSRECPIGYGEFAAVVKKGEAAKVIFRTELSQSLSAPVSKGDVVGKVIYSVGEREIGEADVVCLEGVDEIDFWGVLWRLLAKISLC